MAVALSTAGVKLYWDVREVRPEALSSYTALPSIKSIPDINAEPSSIDVTDLDELEWKKYIPGLKDQGGALTFLANNTEAFQTAWAAMVAASVAGAAASPVQYTWFAIVVPGLDAAFYFEGTPAPLGLSAIDVDNVLETDAHITLSEVVGWEDKPHAGTDFLATIAEGTDAGECKIALDPTPAPANHAYYIKYGAAVTKPSYDDTIVVGAGEYALYTSGTDFTPTEGDEVVVVLALTATLKVQGSYKGTVIVKE